MQVMQTISYGLFLVTAREAGMDNGCIVNTVAQATVTPEQVVLMLNQGSFTHDMILRTGMLHVSVLSQAAEFGLFQRFGFQSGRNVNKFLGFSDFARSKDGLCYLTQGANAWFGAEVVQTLDLGTHTLFVARVLYGDMLSHIPSMTYAAYLAQRRAAP